MYPRQGPYTLQDDALVLQDLKLKTNPKNALKIILLLELAFGTIYNICDVFNLFSESQRGQRIYT